jgi:hypothetical protein
MKKFLVPAVAMIMAIVFSAFTAPKAKTAEGFVGERYWYPVDESSQVILQGTQPFYGLKSQVETPCQDNDPNLDCYRGFDTPINTSMGDVSAVGDEQIKRTQNP